MDHRADAGGGQALAGLASGRLANEEGYLFQKLFRVALGSSNIDSAARFGLLRAVKVLRSQLGFNNPQIESGRFSLRTEPPAVQHGPLDARIADVDQQHHAGAPAAWRSVTSPALTRPKTSTRFSSLTLIHVLPTPNLPQEVSA